MRALIFLIDAICVVAISLACWNLYKLGRLKGGDKDDEEEERKTKEN